MSRLNIEDAILWSPQTRGIPTRATQPAVAIATAGNVTYTADQVLNGRIVRNTSGASRTDTLPTAALLVAAIPNVRVGMEISFEVLNAAVAAETITLAMGAGGTAGNPGVTTAIAQNSSKRVTIRFTNVTSGAEAYVAYGV